MATNQRPDPGQRQEPWEQLYRYWLSKCVEGRFPARADLDPLIEIPQLAQHLILLDVLPEGLRYRLAGSMLSSRLGAELTGNQVGRSTATESKWLDLLSTVAREQKPMMVTSDAFTTGVGRRLGVILPLVDRSGKTECILCGIFFDRDFGPGMQIGNLSVEEISFR